MLGVQGSVINEQEDESRLDNTYRDAAKSKATPGASPVKESIKIQDAENEGIDWDALKATQFSALPVDSTVENPSLLQTLDKGLDWDSLLPKRETNATPIHFEPVSAVIKEPIVAPSPKETQKIAIDLESRK